MPDLIAQGPRPQDRWRRALPVSTTAEPVYLGRASHGWAVPWDDRVSRKHAEVRWTGSELEVSKLLDARNPIFYQGIRRDQFKAGLGEHFVIGQTTFSIVDQRIKVLVSAEDLPAMSEHTFASSKLRQSRYRDADQRIEVLSRLPDIIQGSNTDEDLFHRMVNFLMQGVGRASFVAIVAETPIASTNLVPPEIGPDSGSIPGSPRNGGLSESTAALLTDQGIRILHWDSRSLTGLQFSPSATLIRQALTTRESVLHVWSRTHNAEPSFTQSENVDWAFCTPINSEACPGWVIYIAGDFNSISSPAIRDATVDLTADLHDDLKFTELAATILGMLRQTRLLQRRQDSLRPFFAPVVRHALANRDPDQVLAPREANVSVLFCDLRGFSKQSEESADRLLELLRRVSDALGVMTHQILARDGVVGDFHGDAAMGFWGWPFENAHSVLNAAQAALAIRSEFEAAAAIPNHPLAGFRTGLGIASGKAVAGRIGTVDQVKVTVFGPVVNLAARLESMTKQLRATILIDEATAEHVRKVVSPSIARVRRVARVLPFGIKTPLMVSELLPPEGRDSILADSHVAAYEQAVEAFQSGQWSDAFGLLHQVPAEDRVKDFLTVYIAQHGRTPPADWQGFIRMPEK
ncbi:MAG: adenylate/guanylate cyclase domain-containing protein [Pirellulaceae bacterium]|nr:adenylate/guanylate cyclase domain-containing protein [Pirellulaceae bacterium]